jgi:hypothetical protein
VEYPLDAAHGPPDRVTITHVGLDGSQLEIGKRSEV